MILTISMNPAIDKIYFVESYALGSVHRPIEIIDSAGGKGLNVARVARLLGEEVAVTGFLGGGNGQFLSHKIEELGMSNRFMEIDQETRICINVTDLSNQKCTEVLEAGPIVTAIECKDFLVRFESIIDDVEVITMSGSLPKGLPSDFYSALIQIAKEKNIPVLLDTSGEAAKLGAASKPFLMKPNIDEIGLLYDGPVETMTDLIEAVRALKNSGITLPIISLGKEGSLAGLSDGIYKVSFPRIDIVNTVGSGDAFVAGCAVAMVRNYSEIDLLKLATACGSANTQYGQTGYVEPEKVAEFMTYVDVKKISGYSSFIPEIN